jgi:hypothetical protein
MSRELIESRWRETKGALLEGLSGNRRGVMSTTLENTRKWMLSENATIGSTMSGNIASLNRVILPVIRRVMPTVIANELVGVQPMTGPVAQIHTLRTRYADGYSSTAAGPQGTGAQPGDEALSPFSIAQGYSGSAPGITNPDGGPATTAQMEGTPGRRLTVQLLRQAVEAKTRKLSATWTFEAAQDAQAMHGIDVEAEIMQALATEITTEIDQEILYSLRSLAVTEFTYDQAQVSGTATFVGDEHAALAIMINAAANKIGRRTRRGAANWAVVSNAALTVLQSATTSAFARTTEGTFEAPTNTKYVGTLNSAMKIFVDSYAADTLPVLVGYKGSSEADAAAYYCPYIPLMSSGVVLDPSTFQPVIGFMSRYGYVELTNIASSFGNAGDFLSEIAIQNISFS